MTVSRDDAQWAQIFDDPDGPLGRELESAARKVEEAQKALLSTHGAGRIYDSTFYTDKQGRLRKGWERKPHQASAPGQPPASQTGRLRDAISHVVATDADGLYAEIGVKRRKFPSTFGLLLEHGTKHMAPRPWLKPSLDAAKK